MKTTRLLKSMLLISGIYCPTFSIGQGIPELLYYRFNEADSFVTNMASSPPSGSGVAQLKGGLKQSGSGTCSGTALLGSGVTATTDFVDTKWVTKTSGSWTISFWTSNIGSSSTLFYIFGDNTAASFRCFTNGVAAANNWLLRGGGLVDVLISGGAVTSPMVSTYVYDSAASYVYAYLNGVLVNSVAQTAVISLNGTANFKVGGYSANIGLPNGGLMDEFRFYTRALSASEVAKLRYLGNSYGTVNQSACGSSGYKSPSGKYTWTTSGTYRDTIPNFVSCDSFMTFNLTFGTNTSSTITAVACDRYVSPSGKSIWTKSGTYTEIIKNAGGCDSVIKINLTVNYASYSNIAVTECNSYISPSGTYIWNKTGTYTDILLNAVGCDSVITINLTINYDNSSVVSLSECDTYRSPSGKYVWTKSGSYFDTIPTYLGCDSFISINLTVNYSSTSGISVTECNSYTSPSGSYVFTKSGIYKDTIQNLSGCDSVITIDLTINYDNSSFISPVVCYSYVSPSGKYNWTSSGRYLDTIATSLGCDSFMTIDLTINVATYDTTTRIVCDSYTSPSGKYIWDLSGTYRDTILNMNSCDSFITTHLTVNKANVAVTHYHNTLTAAAVGAQYQWLNCKTGYTPISGDTNRIFTATADGDYAVLVTESSCYDTSICYTISTTGVSVHSFENELSVYPNPSNGLVVVSTKKPLIDAEIRIITANGEILLKRTNLSGNEMMIDLSEKAKGVYIIEVIEKEKIVRFRLIRL